MLGSLPVTSLSDLPACIAVRQLYASSVRYTKSKSFRYLSDELYPSGISRVVGNYSNVDRMHDTTSLPHILFWTDREELFAASDLRNSARWHAHGIAYILCMAQYTPDMI